MAANPEKVHREEGQVEKDKGQPKVNLAPELAHHATEHFREPEVDASKHPIDNTRHDIVDMRHDVVGVVDEDVNCHRPHEHTAEPADQEQEDKAQGEKHRRGEPDRAAP